MHINHRYTRVGFHVTAPSPQKMWQNLLNSSYICYCKERYFIAFYSN